MNDIYPFLQTIDFHAPARPLHHSVLEFHADNPTVGMEQCQKHCDNPISSPQINDSFATADPDEVGQQGSIERESIPVPPLDNRKPSLEKGVYRLLA